MDLDQQIADAASSRWRAAGKPRTGSNSLKELVKQELDKAEVEYGSETHRRAMSLLGRRPKKIIWRRKVQEEDLQSLAQAVDRNLAELRTKDESGGQAYFKAVRQALTSHQIRPSREEFREACSRIGKLLQQWRAEFKSQIERSFTEMYSSEPFDPPWVARRDHLVRDLV